jgi:hypothetical protein
MLCVLLAVALALGMALPLADVLGFVWLHSTVQTWMRCGASCKVDGTPWQTTTDRV